MGKPRLVKTVKEIEGTYHEEWAVVEDDGVEPWPADAALSVVGQPLPRVDGVERVTGRALYASDVVLPGMLHAKILRSPLPHARIRAIDASAAERLPGVVAILHAWNAPRIPWNRTAPVFDEVVRFQGDEVAAVAAVDEDTARDALELIRVEYEPLPFVVDLEDALRPDAPRVWPDLPGNVDEERAQRYQRGDVERGLAEADVVVEATFRTPVALHNCMETHGSVVWWRDDGVIVWDSTQHVFGVRRRLAERLGLPLHQVRVIKQYMGGGFGSKNGLGKYTLIAALLSRRTGRPVRLFLDRHEENLCTGNRHATLQHVRLGARRDGTLTAIDLRAYAQVGIWGSAMAIGGPYRELYRCPNVRTEEFAVYTHTGPTSAFRAPGYVEGTFALESAMDMLAERLGIDPLELRVRNHADHHQVRGTAYTSKGLLQAYEIGARRIGWWSRRRREEGPIRIGVGMASQIWGGGGGPPAYAECRLHPDGTFTVLTGTQDIGTGTRTVLAQIAAEELTVSVDRVKVVLGDTDACPYAPLSAGSMTVPSVGPAVRAAARDVVRQLAELAATVLGVPAEELELHAGAFRVRHDPQRTLPLAELAKTLGNYQVIGKGSRAPNPEGYAINTFGAQFAEVAVNVETGEVRVLRLVAVHDAGRIINPLTAGSQIEGGAIQGVGFALLEERVVDRRYGIVLNANLGDYKVPTVMDVPAIEHETVPLVDPRCNSLGAKGIGEPPIIPTAAAIANAIYHATGVRLYELPITPQRMLEALRAAGVLSPARQPALAGAGGGAA